MNKEFSYIETGGVYGLEFIVADVYFIGQSKHFGLEFQGL